MPVDHSQMKLGKRHPRPDARTLKMGKYLANVPDPPPVVNWGSGFPQENYGYLKNDLIGDCVIAAAGHTIQTWTWDTHKYYSPTDDEIVKAYSAITGYDPATGANDNGTYELDMLNYWRKIGIAGRQILAYADPDYKNQVQVKKCIWLFGSVIIGVALPVTAQTQDIWDVPPDGPVGQGAPGSWGLHGVEVLAYSPQNLICVTWGRLKIMTWDFWNDYVDECHASVSMDWIGKVLQAKPQASGAIIPRDFIREFLDWLFGRKPQPVPPTPPVPPDPVPPAPPIYQDLSPSGFDLATLLADLQAITQGG